MPHTDLQALVKESIGIDTGILELFDAVQNENTWSRARAMCETRDESEAQALERMRGMAKEAMLPNEICWLAEKGVEL